MLSKKYKKYAFQIIFKTKQTYNFKACITLISSCHQYPKILSNIQQFNSIYQYLTISKDIQQYPALSNINQK